MFGQRFGGGTAAELAGWPRGCEARAGSAGTAAAGYRDASAHLACAAWDFGKYRHDACACSRVTCGCWLPPAPGRYWHLVQPGRGWNRRARQLALIRGSRPGPVRSGRSLLASRRLRGTDSELTQPAADPVTELSLMTGVQGMSLHVTAAPGS